MKKITLYQTRDGQQFETEALALAHENEHPEAIIAGLTVEEIGLALGGNEPDIAEALEKLGARIANMRREAVRNAAWAAGLRIAKAEVPPTSAPIYEPGRGARDFHAGICGITPDDLRGTPAADLWHADWGQASQESCEAGGKPGRAA